MEGKTTELVHRESQPVRSVREKIVSFHDTYLRVTPFSSDIVKTFEEILPKITSQKGKEVAQRIRPKLSNIAKNAEMAMTATDLIVGVVGLGSGSKDMVHAISLHKKAKGTQSSDFLAGSYMYAWEGFKKGIFGGIMVAGRPITRLADIGVLPLTKKLVLWTDGILLRKEQQKK